MIGPARLGALLRSRATGAVVAQVWQAVGTFLLQIFAARALGASGLGLLSLCLGIIILATAFASGMVGDSAIVLDRHDRRIRGGLQFWMVVLVCSSTLGVGLTMALTGLLTAGQAALMASALAAFQLEELLRRVFMATMRFWRLVIIDSTAILTALAVIGVGAVLGDLGISTFLFALLIGQVAGLTVGLPMLPPSERVVAPLRGSAIAEVVSFGAWRAAGVSVAPAVLTAVRIIVTLAVGQAALGHLEGARIFAAPALLAVQGLGSYLLSSYVRDKAADLSVLVRRAWRAALSMIGAAVLLGTLITVLAPLLARFVTGPNLAIDRLAVAGWALVVAATASCQPFASLAAARGGQVRVFACRSIDAAVVIFGVWLLLVPLSLSASWAPFALAAGPFLGGALVRQLVLRPLGSGPRDAARQPSPARTSHATR